MDPRKRFERHPVPRSPLCRAGVDQLGMPSSARRSVTETVVRAKVAFRLHRAARPTPRDRRGDQPRGARKAISFNKQLVS
jgi:hypothetical protein